MPKPFVDALTVQARRSARLLVARLELFFERGELGEWRIGVGLPALGALGSTLDIFRAQRRIAIRTIAARRPARAIAARGALAIPLRVLCSFWARRAPLGTIRLPLALGPCGAMGANLPALRRCRRCRRRDTLGARGGRISGKRRSLRFSLCAARPCAALMMRLARVPARPPNLDELLGRRLGLRRGLRRRRRLHRLARQTLGRRHRSKARRFLCWPEQAPRRC